VTTMPRHTILVKLGRSAAGRTTCALIGPMLRPRPDHFITHIE